MDSFESQSSGFFFIRGHYVDGVFTFLFLLDFDRIVCMIF